MKSERLINFTVIHPQLEYDPKGFKGGRKRFYVYKNQVSPAILAVVPLQASETKFNGGTLPSSITKPEKRSPGSLNSRLSISPYDYINYPMFSQPKYTKKQPKAVNSDPILGYTNRYNPSPPMLRMRNYGFSVISNDRSTSFLGN
jgi:hypothetical protein